MRNQVELLKESIDIKDAFSVKLQKKILKLEEENKKLNKKVEEQYYIIQQYEQGFASGSWHGEE